MAGKYEPNEVERYLTDQPPQNEVALRRVRQIILDELPGAVDSISYQVIGFKYQKRFVMHISGWDDHLSFHGGHGMEEMAARYPQWLKVKGATLHFQPTPEIPENVVREVVALRLSNLPKL
ncbi:MAG: DUF1801 domain-containing protein [Micrococcales bacterium]